MAETTTKKSKQEQEKDAKYREAITALEKKYGPGTVIHGKDVPEELEVVSTGSLMMDIATNIGGDPIGKLIEIFGPESSGKSTICYHKIANFQKLGRQVVLADIEQSFDRVYATALGVDVDKLTILQPECQEDMYNQIETLIRTASVSLVVIDSHTAALSKKRIEGEVGDAVVALEARNSSVALGKIKPLLRHNKCTMIGVSQLRTAIGSYGDPDKPTGGNAWKFYTDIRYKVSKTLEKEKESNKTTVEVIKNKCARPWGKAIFSIIWGKGIDRMKELIDLATEYKVIEKASGGWYTLPDDAGKFQGDDKLKEFFSDNPEYAEKFEKDVLAEMRK